MRAMWSLRLVLCSWALGWASHASAAGAQGPEIALYPQSRQASAQEIRESVYGEPRVRNVTSPTLTAYLPDPAKATGTAVIVAPGGGFIMLSIKSEGEDVAHWLNERGVTAFVLKYRLNPTPADSAAFQAELAKLMTSAARGSDAAGALETSAGARQAMADGLEAVKWVRQRAAEFHIDPHRIGFLGFSAGAMVSLHVATAYDPNTRPDFVGSIYGSLPGGAAIPKDAPPLFLAVAADDPLLAHASTPVFEAWEAEHHPAELHIYHMGGHGFGMKSQGHSSDHWIDELGWWMDSEGLLKVASPATAIAPPTTTRAAAQSAIRPWTDTRLSADRRAALLNRELTLDERITLVHGLMAMPFKGTVLPQEAILAAGYVPGIPRLGIPALYETDASLGVANPMRVREGDGATALPSGLALAATFNPELAYAGGAMIGSEARAKGFNVLLAGGVNLTRQPRNGRNFEYLGEDPLLAGTLAGESIRGIQSNHIISTIKHFALNDQETGRHVVNELIDETALRESDLLAFELAIEAGHPGSVMCAYNKLNGPYACGNRFLLNHVLKGDWSYPGWVMSDWGAVYATDYAIEGLDQESGEQLDRQVWFGAPLREAVQAGRIPTSRLENMTLRILRSMFANGLFDNPPQRADIDYAAHAQVARKEASEGIVLLRNEGAVLPMASSTQRVLIVGGRADVGTLSGGGSSQVFPPHADPSTVLPANAGGELAAFNNIVFQSASIVEAIRARAPKSTVTYDNGQYPGRAAGLAKQSDVVIVFATQWTAEGLDVPDLTLPAGQDELIEAVAAANPHTIVVLESGGPVEMPWLEHTAAVLEAWYPGAGGADAISDVLFGIVNPSGHLPMSFPATSHALPGEGFFPGEPFDAPHPNGAAVGYRSADQKALFPFGFGLSYTQFSYHNLRLTGPKQLTVAFDVRNDGKVAGKNAAQVYATSAAGVKIKRLVGFTKVELSPGDTTHVSIRVDPRLLASFDAKQQRWHRSAGDYRIEVGAASQGGGLAGNIHLQDDWQKP